LQANTNDSKFIKTGIIGILSIIPTFIATDILIMPMAGLAMPVTTAMGVALATSIVIGYTGQKIITSVSKKKMKKFTDAKTNADILEEMMHYEMEIDKSKNRKETLRKMYKSIESKEKISKDYPNEFYHIDKCENLTTEELQKRKEMLTKAYNERIEQLDVLTSQKYLKNKFKSYRNKKNRIENIIIGAFGISMLFSVFLGMPLSLELINKHASLGTLTDFAKYIGMCFAPTIVVFPLSIPYFYKRNKDIMNVFSKLNQTLGENSLSENQNVEYEQNLSDMITTKMCEIIELGIDLKETTHTLERITTEQAKQTDKEDNRTAFQVISNGMDKLKKLQIDSSQNILNPQPQDDRSSLKVAKTGLRKVGKIKIEPPKDGVDVSWVEPYLAEDIEEDVTLQQEQSGQKLVKRRTLTNKNDKNN